jgi:hypothetical protein
MKAQLDCLICLLRQALEASKVATDDEHLRRQVIYSVMQLIPRLSPEMSPPEMSQYVYQLVSQITGNNDPYHQVKVQSNKLALSFYPQLKEIISDSEEPLLTASKLAIAGNSIDLAPQADYGDLGSLISLAVASPLAIDHYDDFCQSLQNSSTILYLGDNAGETVFDKLLIEELLKIKPFRVYFVVRDKPVINDATKEDALAIGLDKVAEIISNGSDAPATILSQCSPEMLKLYHSADLIIAKGQGNYESLSEESSNIFFLLKAKCPIVARLFGVKVGDAILKGQMVSPD